MTPERIAALVTRWVRFYTRELPPSIGERRLDEIVADLHDHIAQERADGTSDRHIAVSILSRMVRGVAADFSWRDQHAKAMADRPTTPGGPMNTHEVGSPASSRQRPLSVTILSILAALGGIGVVLAVLAGALVVHGIRSLDATDAVIILPLLAVAAVYLAFAYGAWTLRSWGWTLGVLAGAASIVYATGRLVGGWADLMVDAPPLALVGVLVVVIATVGLFLWFRPNVKAAFERA